MVPEVVHQIVEEFKDAIPVIKILEILSISKSTFYRWKKDGVPTSDLTKLEVLIINLCKETKYRYGYRKITALLNRTLKINKNTVQKIMQKHKCNCRVKKKRHYGHGKQAITADNIIERDFNSDIPLKRLVTDITYLPFGRSMLYLSSIQDLYNGEIIAYTLSNKQDLECVIDTLSQLPDYLEGCVLHSDQGAVYTSEIYQNKVKEKGITMSMSRKGTPADNATIESFHSSLKCETFYLQPELKSSNAIVSQTVIDYIQYYNEKRIQEKLGYLSPIEYREQDPNLSLFY